MGDIPPSVTPSSGAEADLDGHMSAGSAQAPLEKAEGHSYPSTADSQNAFASQLDMSSPPPPGAQGKSFDMGQMAHNLPQLQHQTGPYSRGGQPPRFNPAASPAMMQNTPPMYQYGPAMSMGPQNYYLQQPQQMGQYYGGGQLSPGQSSSLMSSRPNMPYYPGHMIMNHPQSGYYSHTAQYPTHNQGMPASMMPGQYGAGNPTMIDPRMQSPPPDGQQFHDGVDGRPGAVRGPPRKPRQSGHAIWIGNLPPQTDLMSLVHHVCKEALGLESLFLISKSNCAFANFKDEQLCVAAQQKLHDSKFQAVRLVSRLRKSTVESATGATAPTGPAAASSSLPILNDEISNANFSEPNSPSTASGPTNQGRVVLNAPVDGSRRDKFFILKSLTVDDLEQSVRTGEWATQSHNEETLNKAFKNADNVYLVFSANKSGEYFGYARMISQINEDPAAAIKFAPRIQETNDPDLPRAIPTEATDNAPRGRIIDDSSRGTIFWEVEREDSDDLASDNESDVEGENKDGQDGETQTWGKPFRLEWLSSSRLPFYRTRGLRNPWNSNREVKIARDGTELEPSVGRRLIGLFNRMPTSNQYGAGMRAPMGMMPGYPQIRPYGPG